MLRWILFILALVLLTAAVLTCVKAPTLTTWMVAVLVDEFGHWLALLALAMLITILTIKTSGPVRWMSVVCCLLAIPLLLKPTLQAWKMSWALPARLEAVFGPAQLAHPPFELKRLFAVSFATKIRPTVEVYARAGKPDAQSLDFYRAVNRSKRPAPCVIIVHGGGWDNGDRKELPALDTYLARRGYAVAAISYRLAPKYPWPAQREDILEAIAYLKKRATALNIDPTQFVLFGRSAGGNLAEAVGYAAQDPAIKGVVAFYAPADLHFAWAYAKEDDLLNSFLLLKQFLGGTPDSVGRGYDEASGYLLVNKSTPPTLLVHGELDCLVWHRQSERLDTRLEENGVPHVFVSLPWATHGFDYNLNGPSGQIAVYALENFLAGVTK